MASNSNPVRFEIVMGDRINTKFLYVFEEEQFYTRDGNVKLGENWKCRNRKCPSRVIKISETECIKLVTAKPHNHSESCAQTYNLKAKQTIRNQAKNIHAIASGSRITSSNSLFKDGIIK